MAKGPPPLLLKKRDQRPNLIPLKDKENRRIILGGENLGLQIMLIYLKKKLIKLQKGGSPFLQRPLGLQTRITILVALIVVSVLVIFSYIDFRLTEHSQRELIRERAIYVIREIDSKIYSSKDLENKSFLEEEIAGWMYTRPSLKNIDIFTFYKNTYRIQASSAERIDLGISYRDLESLKMDRVISTLKGAGDESYWEILAPLHIGRKIIGGIRVVASLEEAQSFLAKKRSRTIIFTLASVAILILILTLFFSRAINRPIQRLVRAMSEAEEGKLTIAVPITSKDELGLLTDHFNRMLARLSQFNEELSRRIELATKELAQRNEELRIANESLFQAQRQLVQAEKFSALGHMAATMAHEIGTPLNSISGYIQLMLMEGNHSEIMTRRLKIIESQLERLTQTIRNLLNSTRLPAPKLEPLNITQVLEEVINLTQPGLSLRGVQLIKEFRANLPLIYGDPVLLQQVFINLVNNALDAMPEGGTLTISTNFDPSLSGETKFLEVAVADTGIGMSEEIKKKATEPFFTTKEPGKGAGLGLAICEEIIRSHKGKLVVESALGKGSTIKVYLPIIFPEVI